MLYIYLLLSSHRKLKHRVDQYWWTVRTLTELITSFWQQALSYQKKKKNRKKRNSRSFNQVSKRTCSFRIGKETEMWKRRKISFLLTIPVWIGKPVSLLQSINKKMMPKDSEPLKYMIIRSWPFNSFILHLTI